MLNDTGTGLHRGTVPRTDYWTRLRLYPPFIIIKLR